MDYTPNTATLVMVLLVVLTVTHLASAWPGDWRPNYVSREPEIEISEEKFFSEFGGRDSFRLLLTEDDNVFIGAKNRVYNLRLKDLHKESTLEWKADDLSTKKCKMNSKTDCSNYIRVVVRKEDRLYICGTNAYNPKCRHYKLEAEDEFKMQRDREKAGTAFCPFDAESNATALYTGGQLYTATRAQSDGTGPLILQSLGDNDPDSKRRTMDGDSTVLNEPNFVSSYEKDDKIYFFFRERAVENLNCGNAVFSRVARVCKRDQGGQYASYRNTFTSFFKARLNCSMPGEFPFYFNEIESTTEFGQGHYHPTKDSGDRSDMIYGVFNTPDNSIRGSAVCAFSYRDIEEAFRGNFKGQETHEHNWLAINWRGTPSNLSQKCMNNSRDLPVETVNFIRNHPLMNRAVKATGGMPMLVFTSFKAKFTQIAVDWQLLAADKSYYDVMFVGTDDGRVIKAINKGDRYKVDSVVIEDIQVLPPGQPVIGLKLVSNRVDQSRQKLVVVSNDKAVNIPLHRCERAKSCTACVALQDPYCAWNSNLKLCISAETGLQDIGTGKHSQCKDDPADLVKPTEPPVQIKSACSCPDGRKGVEFEEEKGYGGRPEGEFWGSIDSDDATDMDLVAMMC